MDPAYYGTQFFNGLVQGGFYALLALGLSVIFGLLRVVNFAHGAMYMLGAFVAYYGGQLFGLNGAVFQVNTAAKALHVREQVGPQSGVPLYVLESGWSVSTGRAQYHREEPR